MIVDFTLQNVKLLGTTPVTHRLTLETVLLDDEHAMDEFDQ
jgi:hypothetical protein